MTNAINAFAVPYQLTQHQDLTCSRGHYINVRTRHDWEFF